MDATLEQLAERGEDAITLRGITDAAEANVAAVSYHFGSLKSLRDAAIEHALERYLDAQRDAVLPIGPASTLAEVAAGFGGPMMRALAAGGRELAVMRIVARVATNPPAGWERLGAKFDQIRAMILPALRANLPGVEDEELVFRSRCVAGLLNWLVLAPIGVELGNEPAGQVERLVVPVLAGAFRGTSTG